MGKDDLSSFDYALSIHAAAPRIQAHYQYYNTTVAPSVAGHDEDACSSWVSVPFAGQRYCSADLDEKKADKYGEPGSQAAELPFDRVLGDALSEHPSVLYADITSKSFRVFHKTLSKTAKGGKTSYRVRYRPSKSFEERPLTVSGYGVELALKRTDYIVIDDRATDDAPKDTTSGEVTLNEEDVADLRPLSSSEVRDLAIKAASFVMGSESPFETLLQLSRDFPKHSSSIAAAELNEEFVKEQRSNRGAVLPGGYNILWINGVQVMARDIDAYSLLEHLRHERKLVNGLRNIGLTAPQAIDLLSNEAISAAQQDRDVQRFDWRDTNEGGNVIIWLNDIEKDKRYADWPSTVNALFQRTYPGQLPPVRRDIHNVVIPTDFSSFSDVGLLIESLQDFVKRGVPIRFGLVARTQSTASVDQAKIVYYLIDRHGLSAALQYLELSLTGAGRKFGAPEEKYFTKATQDRKLRTGRTALSYRDLLKDAELDERINAASAYISRFGSVETPPILTNGVPIANKEDWLQAMSQRIGLDLRSLQQALMERRFGEEDWLPEAFLQGATLRRNPYIVPEDEKEIRHINLGDHPEISLLPRRPAAEDTIERELVQLVVAADLDTKEGFQLVLQALLFQREHDNVQVSMLHLADSVSSSSKLSQRQNDVIINEILEQYDAAVARQSLAAGETLDTFSQLLIYQELHQSFITEASSTENDQSASEWAEFQDLRAALAVSPGHQAILLNGRVVGPIPAGATFDSSDFETLLAYERKKRLLPAAAAIESMELKDIASDPASFARISNLIALSTVSDVPEGFFEAAPTVRSGLFKTWKSEHTTIKVGDFDTAAIQIHASIDPASELAQRWLPIIKVLSELDGVYLSLFLNPQDRLSELPVKRFYRHVLSSKPEFAADGALQPLQASFAGLPSDALLNMGMDIPSAWLVAPKVSIHDLDNIKLSAVKGNADIDAIYELEHILIEGHSRDVTTGQPPRGAQLVLGTELEPHFADTIIMANLGYFQFKANPGVYDLKLQPGRSEEIFHIDSAGSKGYGVHPGDNNTEIALMSFRGITLYPRLARKPDMDDQDVLEAPKTTLDNLAEGAEQLLAQAGLPDASRFLSQAAKFGSNLLGGSGGAVAPATKHADINIFSVASGHLYERMLNIMMLSVMKHTTHTVKFWFIEQFLSPSFKDFLPAMAAEYGFQYEMVTYKWPHWLRGQKEKQREIWGYKILFLDVLFPLDLDKVIFVDADQIVRTDMYELVQHDLHGAPYGFTPMCDSRVEMEGFRFWKQGYWKNFLKGLPYHISALYVVDLKEFRRIAAGDRLRQNYQALSADANSLSNLDQDLPNHMQAMLPIHSLPQEWLWCETWCSDESLKDAKTIDLCNNPQTKEPKLDRARRQVPEWTVYDDEIAAVAKRHRQQRALVAGGDAATPGAVAAGEESIQEALQREDADRERKVKEQQKKAGDVPEHNEL